MQKRVIECVPNFSEGRDHAIIRQITDVIESVEGVTLLDVDSGKATNRTVVTFVGEPEPVIEAAFRAIVKASHLIDMSKHKGEHPRMGATDVCPLVPVSGISMEETAAYARQLAKRVGTETNIPVYLYGYAQDKKDRDSLSVIRSGEYEGFFEKIKRPEWKPDFGKAEMNVTAGATVIGARDFLIAYNVNLNSKSTRIANRIAFDVREAGRVVRKGNPYSGQIVMDENGEPLRVPGVCKEVKAIGWYIEEYGVAQISANLTNYKVTPVHVFFDEVCKSAESRGVRVTGSELVGLIPLEAMLEASRYFLKKQDRSEGVSDKELIHIAVKSLGLDELGSFDPHKKIIEYRLEAEVNKLMNLSCIEFADEAASESVAPGGGTVAAFCGALGASLGTMVANLSANKKGWEARIAEFSETAVKGQNLKNKLLFLADEDTRSFNAILSAFRLPKETEEDKKIRSLAIETASEYAAKVPLEVMTVANNAYVLLEKMIKTGNPNSITDAGVGCLCINTAIEGACMNVMVNAKGLKDRTIADQLTTEARRIRAESRKYCEKLTEQVEKAIQ
jgi:glutamate formiminotransferase/formiminotetrahydrofolate cyclodeaminase